MKPTSSTLPIAILAFALPLGWLARAEGAPAGQPTCQFQGTAAPVAAPEIVSRAMDLLQEAAGSDDAANRAVKNLQPRLADKLKVLVVESSKLEVVNGARRLAVQLANPPPTRLRLSFDSDRDGRHVEVEWDPTVSSQLGRAVTLDEGVWSITAAVEPSTYTQQAGSVVIHTRFDPVRSTDASATATTTLEGSYVALVAALNVPTGSAERPMLGWPRPRLTLACLQLPSMEGSQFAAAPATANASGLRGFGVAPAVITDTLSILAELAVERAKAGAMRALQRRMIDPFCKNDTRVTLARLGMGHDDGLALPRTCELLLSLRIEDILSSGRPVLIALRDDLRYTVAPAALSHLSGADEISHTLLQSVLTLANAAIDRGGIDAIDVQLALEFLGNVQKLGIELAPQLVEELDAALAAALGDLVRFADPSGVACAGLSPAQCTAKVLVKLGAALGVTCAEDDRKQCETAIRSKLREIVRTPLSGAALHHPALVALLRAAIDDRLRVHELVGFACQARLAVAVIKHCQHHGCSTQDIAGMVTTPERYFDIDPALPLALCWTAYGEYRAPPPDVIAVQQAVVDGIRLVAPVVDGKGRERARAAVRLLIDLLHRWRGNQKIDRHAPAFAEIAYALIDEDYGAALNSFLRLAGQLQPGAVPAPVRKVVQLIGAVSSYAVIYKQTKDDDPKAAHEARKKALASLIDSATDRADREDDDIVSLGSNVGLSATFTTFTWSHREVAVRVPLGLALDTKRLHAAVQLADLGQFVRRGTDDKLDDVRWSDFLAPGFELGVSLRVIPALKLPRELNLAVHLSYAPSIAPVTSTDMSPPDGVWRYGISLAYYVPFFDFN